MINAFTIPVSIKVKIIFNRSNTEIRVTRKKEPWKNIEFILIPSSNLFFLSLSVKDLEIVNA